MPLSRVLSDSDEIWSIPFLPWVQMVPVGEKRPVSCYITGIHQGAGLQAVRQRCDSSIQTATRPLACGWMQIQIHVWAPQRFLCSSPRLPLREALNMLTLTANTVVLKVLKVLKALQLRLTLPTHKPQCEEQRPPNLSHGLVSTGNISSRSINHLCLYYLLFSLTLSFITPPPSFLLSAAVKADVQSSPHNVFLPPHVSRPFPAHSSFFLLGPVVYFFSAPIVGIKNREILFGQIKPIFLFFSNLLNYINLFLFGKKDCGPLVYGTFGPIHSMKRKRFWLLMGQNHSCGYGPDSWFWGTFNFYIWTNLHSGKLRNTCTDQPLTLLVLQW